MATVTELLQPVETDLETLLGDLRSLIGAGHPSFRRLLNILFSAGGKHPSRHRVAHLKSPGPGW